MNPKTTFASLITSSLIALAGCATSGHWSASGGNRELGVVKVSYEYAQAEEPQLNDAQANVQANVLAENRCNTWGYARAQLIPGVVRDCTAADGNACAVWKVTREYQCRHDEGNAPALADERAGASSFLSRLSR